MKAFADYVTMKRAKVEASSATDAPAAADTAGLKPEPPSAKPAFGAAAMLMKKAAEKKSEILKERPGQPDAPEPAAAAKPDAEAKPKFDIDNETGRFDLSQLKAFEAKKAAESAAGTAAQADSGNAAPPAGLGASFPFGRRDDETGRINMRELMEQMPPHMAAALDKSTKSFEPGEEPQMLSGPAISSPVSPPNQFNRDAILPNIKAEPTSSKTNLPSKTPPAEDAKDKKKKTRESGKPGDPPQSQVVKNIQKMAPLSSMRAAEHHDLATQEVKAEHKELLNQTNQIKNKMMNVPDTAAVSELERVWGQRFVASMQFIGKNQRVLVGAAAVLLVVTFVSVFTSNMGQDDLVKKVADKYQHKQYDEATELVDKGLVQYPNNAVLHFYKASLLNKGGQVDQAVAELSAAASLDPNSLDEIEKRAKLYVEMRKFREALADYNRLLESPNYRKANIYANRATAHIELKEYDYARSDADAAVKLDPSKPDYYATRAYALAGMNDFNDAIKDWTTVISKDKNDANAYAERGRAEYSMKQTAKALADLAKSLAIKPNGTAYYYRGLIYLDQKKTELAIQELNQALKYDSSNASYRETVAQLYANTGNYQQALRNYDAVGALQRNSDSPELLQSRAMAEMSAHRNADAARDWERYIALKPDTTWAMLLHAECCLSAQEYSKAYDAFTALIAKEPKNVNAILGRAQVSVKEKHYDLATQDFERAIAIDPKKPQIYIFRGVSNAAQGAYEPAILDFKHALALQPDNALAKQRMHDLMEERAKTRTIALSSPGVSTAAAVPRQHLTGDAVTDGYNLMNAGDLSGATQLLAKAVVKDPNNANARRYLAYCLVDSGNTRDSISQFKALDQMGVLNTTDQSKYIDALTKSGDLAQASVVVARKLAIHPDNVSNRIQLANLYMQLRWRDKARQVVLYGLEHTTTPSDTDTLRSLLQQINTTTADTTAPNAAPKPVKNVGG